MTNNTKRGLVVVVAALLLGVWGDNLLRATPWGINVLCWMTVLTAFLAAFGSERNVFKGAGGVLLLPLVFFAAAFAWHDSLALGLLNILASLVALSLVILRAQGGQVWGASLMDYALAGMAAALNALVGMFSLLVRDVQWKEMSSSGWSAKALAVGRGVLLAVPPLFVFGGLFMSADAVFDSLVRRVFHLDLDALVTHAALTGFVAWIVAGFFRGMLWGNEFPRRGSAPVPPLSPAILPPGMASGNGRGAAPPAVNPVKLGTIEIGITLGLLDVLFLSFVIVQLRYFFGGAALVQATRGLTYAQYAREGFFELVAVAALVLPLLLLAHWLLRKERPGDEGIFRALAGVQIVLLFIIMASAFERMRLYQQEYGLTGPRLYVTAFMGWLAVVFIWFVLTVLRGHRERFAFGAMAAGFLLIAVLHLLNPDALIASTNTARARAGRSFDARHAAWLSADAVPALVAALDDLNPRDRGIVAAGILAKYRAYSADPDWRNWNWARAQAMQVVRENLGALEAAASACPPEKD